MRPRNRLSRLPIARLAGYWLAAGLSIGPALPLANVAQAADVAQADVAEIDAAPVYADKANLLQYHDASGRLQPVKAPADWQHRARHTLLNMQKAMGPLPAESSQPLEIRRHEEVELRHYVRQHLSFAVEPGDRAFAYLLVPRETKQPDARLPAMICLPGSSAPGKDRPAGLTSSANMAYAHELAERGYVCLVIDYPLTHAREYKTDPYDLGYVSATMKGVVNHRRGVSLLQSLTFVDPEAIGVIGHSLGGHNALFLAAFDPRVKAVVSSCGFNVFAKHAGGDVRAWSSRYYMPYIKTRYGDDPARIPFDFTEVLGALAPRPVYVNAPLHDAPDFEVSGVRDCIVAAEPIYRLFGASTRLVVEYPDAGHDFPARQRQAAYAFLDRHLRRAQEAESADGQATLERGLVAHWPLKVDGADHSSEGRNAQATEVTFQAIAGRPAAQLDGRSSRLELAADQAPRWGRGDFSIAAWVRLPQSDDDLRDDDLLGDLVSCYDPARRKGFHLSIKDNAGVAFSQPNRRVLQFGIDDNRETSWVDCGRPGNALLGFSMAAHDGALYVGTCEPGADERGRVYRYAGGQQWIDCGAPDASNAVTSMAVYQGQLYVGTGKYRVAGSSLPESQNENLGGRIFRYDGGERWIACGRLPDCEAVSALAVFNGELYAGSLYRPAGFFRYQPAAGDQPARWIDCGTPDGKRVEALGVYRGHLYATSYDNANVYRYDGRQWTDCGRVGENTQTYSFAVYEGRLYVATWPSGRVYRFDGLNEWVDVGRLGEELEVMGMLVHNGRFVAGTLPLAETYVFESAAPTPHWRRLAQLDLTPDVKYRRAWTMAEHQGQVFCSTLPSGKIFAAAFGVSAAWEYEFPAGWRHVAAIKRQGRLELYVDGELVSRSIAFSPDDYDLNVERPLQIGLGANDYFRGALSDLRLYDRALTPAEIEALAESDDRGR